MFITYRTDKVIRALEACEVLYFKENKTLTIKTNRTDYIIGNCEPKTADKIIEKITWARAYNKGIDITEYRIRNEMIIEK